MKKEIVKMISSNLGTIMNKVGDSVGKTGSDRSKLVQTVIEFIADGISKNKGGGQGSGQPGQGGGQRCGQGKGRVGGSGRGTG